MSIHAEWLSLIEVSGAFLAEPVLDQAFPQGLEGLEASKKQAFRQTYEEWREALDTEDELHAKLHQEWINWVLKTGLEWDEDDEGEELKAGSDVPEHLKLELLEHNLTIRPDYALFGNDADKPYLLVASYPAHINLDEVVAGDGWSTSPAERMSHLCRATGTRLGLVTNGEQWMVVDAPEGGITSYAGWYARLWSQEPITLKAFFSLLNISRVFNGFGLDAKKLTDLLDESLKHQDEVTETLGSQVQRAVEVLIQSLDRINNDSNGELLNGVEPSELYEAGLTYMMRLVFLLCAEERGLLLLGDETYEANYAVSTLRMKLREEAGLHGEEVLSYRNNAWARLLSVFRAVYGGVEHESMRMSALGGSLFDPDRFPFLEGRAKDSNWKLDEARPLPIDNRTVLLFLDAIQLFQGRTLSYRALDVEQIGYVYEGLLERTVIRASDVTLELDSTKSAKTPWIHLGDLESAQLDGETAVKKLLKERTGSSASRVKNDLAKEVTEAESETLLLACQNDSELRDRIKPYFHFLRRDAWDNPLLYPKNSFMVATGTDRRETGTHYTPTSLTETIVRETLEPLVYIGVSGGSCKVDWKLKTPAELLDLKICDPAMGSGAFLVQACRYLSERLVEAWALSESSGKVIAANGSVVDQSAGVEHIGKNPEERFITACRLVSEKCIYGLDINPLAVELAKLSIWLLTLSKGRPFGFLDHNLKHGDSLLGITEIDQLNLLDMSPTKLSEGGGVSKHLFSNEIERVVKESINLRLELRKRQVLDVKDIEVLAQLDKQSREKLELPLVLADALIGDCLKVKGKRYDHTILSIQAEKMFSGDSDVKNKLKSSALSNLNVELPEGKRPRSPFHWCLEFPEVFVKKNRGFDAVIGNPPFLGNKYWRASFGSVFQKYAKIPFGIEPGKIDLSALFHWRSYILSSSDGIYGLIGPKGLFEGDALSVCQRRINKLGGDIKYAISGFKWPGEAQIFVSIVVVSKSQYKGIKLLNGSTLDLITESLTPYSKETPVPEKLKDGIWGFEGVHNGKGDSFVISKENRWFDELANQDSISLVPYITGNDISTGEFNKPKRYVLDILNKNWSEVSINNTVKNFLVTAVQPTRSEDILASYSGLAERWWQFWRPKNKDLTRLRKQQCCLAFPKISKYAAGVLIDTSYIFTNKVVVIETSDPKIISACSSDIFEFWLKKYSGSMGKGVSISLSKAVFTFPLPDRSTLELSKASEEYHKQLNACMADKGIGITGVLNLVHSQSNDLQISTLRERRINLSICLIKAYGWLDIELDYDFYEAHEGEKRFSINPSVLNEIIYRLALLNRDYLNIGPHQLSTKNINLRPSDEVHPDLFGS